MRFNIARCVSLLSFEGSSSYAFSVSRRSLAYEKILVIRVSSKRDCRGRLILSDSARDTQITA